MLSNELYVHIIEGDTLVFFNYRADRMREITECIGMEKYKEALRELAKH